MKKKTKKGTFRQEEKKKEKQKSRRDQTRRGRTRRVQQKEEYSKNRRKEKWTEKIKIHFPQHMFKRENNVERKVLVQMGPQ